MSSAEIVQAYRRLYRVALQSVLYASPARYAVRDAIRTGFRLKPASAYNTRRIDNTEDFLKRAASYTGIEHKIIKHLVHVRFWQNHVQQRAGRM